MNARIIYKQSPHPHFSVYSFGKSCLRRIVCDRRSINASISSRGGIPKSAAIFSRVPSLGSDLLLNHSDHILISSFVRSLKSLRVSFKNSFLLIDSQTAIRDTIKLVELLLNKKTFIYCCHDYNWIVGTPSRTCCITLRFCRDRGA